MDVRYQDFLQVAHDLVQPRKKPRASEEMTNEIKPFVLKVIKDFRLDLTSGNENGITVASWCWLIWKKRDRYDEILADMIFREDK